MQNIVFCWVTGCHMGGFLPPPPPPPSIPRIPLWSLVNKNLSPSFLKVRYCSSGSHFNLFKTFEACAVCGYFWGFFVKMPQDGVIWGAHSDHNAIELNITFKSVLNMYNLETGAIALTKKDFFPTKLAVEHDFCDSTYDWQWIAS